MAKRPCSAKRLTKPLREGNGGAAAVFKSRCRLAPHPRDLHREREVTAGWKTCPPPQRQFAVISRTGTPYSVQQEMTPRADTSVTQRLDSYPFYGYFVYILFGSLHHDDAR